MTYIGFKNFRSKSGTKASVKKVKNVFNNLDDEFISDDVKKELDKYKGLTEVSSPTVSRYIKEMEKFGLIEFNGYMKTGKTNRKTKYRKIK